jgi:transitional endoplasmic reticulum ATPase
MEQSASKYRFGRILEANLALLGRKFALTRAERTVLALAVLLRADEELHQVALSAKNQINAADQIATIIGMSASAVAEALSQKSRLRRSGLVEAQSGASPAHNLQLSRGRLRGLGLARMASIDDLFEAFLRACPPTKLSGEDYVHLTPDFDFVANLIDEALVSKRLGVNILLHGPPGTGKTELARTIAKRLGVPLFEVSSIDENGDPLHPKARLAGAATAHYLLGDRRAALVFDEVDAIFNDGSDFFGKPTTAESAKAWVNNLLEQNQVPTIWIANRIWNMDPAFLRRFDLVIQLDTPPMKQRLRLLERECGSFLDATQLHRFARIDTVTPGVVSRAASVTRRVKDTGRPRAEILEAILDGTLRAQGLPTVRRSCRGTPPSGYDITLCNANADLEALAEGMARSKAGRICLYGPPGTGKTAFGYWLASTLDRPLILKRTSDLQSPFIGVMERNLAKAFEQAAQDHAVLQIDEVDSFLQDRRGARQSWEVSQVNEFLTQLESFDGIFIASTNLMDGLDLAALRRFDHKIRIDFLRHEQSWRMFCRLLDGWELPMPEGAGCRKELARMTTLTPGDFAVVTRRHALTAFGDAQHVIAALRLELEFKGGTSRRIGFV